MGFSLEKVCRLQADLLQNVQEKRPEGQDKVSFWAKRRVCDEAWGLRGRQKTRTALTGKWSEMKVRSA